MNYYLLAQDAWRFRALRCQSAQALLVIIHERGARGLPLERLYRHLFNRHCTCVLTGRSTATTVP